MRIPFFLHMYHRADRVPNLLINCVCVQRDGRIGDPSKRVQISMRKCRVGMPSLSQGSVDPQGFFLPGLPVQSQELLKAMVSGHGCLLFSDSGSNLMIVCKCWTCASEHLMALDWLNEEIG